MIIPNKFWIFILSLFDGPNRSKRLICPINFVFYPNITTKKKGRDLKLFTQTGKYSMF